MSRLPAPISDYVTDTKSVLDQSLRILQAITDVSADAGWLDTALATMLLVQSLMQVCAWKLAWPCLCACVHGWPCLCARVCVCATTDDVATALATMLRV